MGLTDEIEALCPKVMDCGRFGVACTVAQIFHSPTEQVRRLDLPGRSAVERFAEDVNIPMKVMYLFFRRRWDLKDFFQRGVISESTSGDTHSEHREDRIEKKRPGLQALMKSVLGPITGETSVEAARSLRGSCWNTDLLSGVHVMPFASRTSWTANSCSPSSF